MSQNKSMLLATFLDIQENEDGIDVVNKFINNLIKDYNIERDKVFIIKNLTNEKQYILTFILDINIGEHIDFNEINPGTISIHKNKETNTIYTINSLNKLIEKDSKLDKGNINYKNIKIDWSKYKNTCIILKNGELTISRTKRIFI
jgi:hypothetical protein